MTILSIALLLVDKPGTPLVKGDEVVILDRAWKDDESEGWWVEAEGHNDVFTARTEELAEIIR